MADKIKINDKEYEKGVTTELNSGEAYCINKVWYKASDCVYNYSLNRYVTKQQAQEENLVEGVVDFKDGDFVLGMFSETFTNRRIETKKGIKILLFEDIAINNGYILNNTNVFVPAVGAKVVSIYAPLTIKQDFKKRFPYGATNDIEKHLEYLSKLKMNNSKAASNIAKVLKGLSFGVEFETTAGLLSKGECLENGLIPLRDGSIEGLEYVTVPLAGDNGVQTLFNAVSLLDSKTSVNHTCALHFHFGNIPRDPKFITALWIVITHIQDTLYRYQDTYKQDCRGFKKKDYSSKLPIHVMRGMQVGSDEKSVNESFKQIIKYLGMGMIKDDTTLDKITVHPADPTGQQKWNVKTRYAILNMIPLIFGNKKTVEFRHHDICTNPNDVLFELLMDAAIINYTIDNTDNILNNKVHITLENIINTMNGDSSIINSLYDYIHIKRNFLCGNFKKGVNGAIPSISNSKQLGLKHTKPVIKQEEAIKFFKKYNTSDFNNGGILQNTGIVDLTTNRVQRAPGSSGTLSLQRIFERNENIISRDFSYRPQYGLFIQHIFKLINAPLVIDTDIKRIVLRDAFTHLSTVSNNSITELLRTSASILYIKDEHFRTFVDDTLSNVQQHDGTISDYTHNLDIVTIPITVTSDDAFSALMRTFALINNENDYQTFATSSVNSSTMMKYSLSTMLYLYLEINYNITSQMTNVNPDRELFFINLQSLKAGMYGSGNVPMSIFTRNFTTEDDSVLTRTFTITEVQDIVRITSDGETHTDSGVRNISFTINMNTRNICRTH